MGNGAGKKTKNIAQQETQKPWSTIEPNRENRSRPLSPQLPAISSSRRSIRSRPTSLYGGVSPQKSVTNLPNGSVNRISPGEVDNDTLRESDDELLPPIDSSVSKSKSRPSTGPSPAVAQPSTVRSRADLHSSCGSHKRSHRKSSAALHGQVGRCSHCPHCRRMTNHRVSSVPTAKWITENPGPGPGQLRIIMDEYDVEAVKKKIISENGHLPGSYDYRPHLTIEDVNEYDPRKENYYTQTVVATTKPRVLPTSTPFPEYELLQRREQRLNKPYSLSLFNY